jgi:putative transposase
MVSLVAKRHAASYLQGEYRVSERRACRVLDLPRSTKRRTPGNLEQTALVTRIHELSAEYPRFGYRKVFEKLIREGVRVGRERVRLIRKREGLQVPQKQRKRCRAGKSTTDEYRALYPNHVWSYDFVADQTADGRRLRFLTVIDEYTREASSRRAGRELGSPGDHQERQRPGTRGSKSPGLALRSRYRHAIHRSREPLAKWPQ